MYMCLFHRISVIYHYVKRTSGNDSQNEKFRFGPNEQKKKITAPPKRRNKKKQAILKNYRLLLKQKDSLINWSLKVRGTTL